jgi:AcrR family transcriptional regulator
MTGTKFEYAVLSKRVMRMPRINGDYHRQDAKNKIITAALSIAAESGWDAVTLEAIARKVGVTKPALYSYFKNREMLLHELIFEVFQNVETAIAATLEKEEDLTQMIHSLAEVFFEQQKPYTSIFYQLPARIPNDSPFKEKFIQINDKNRDLIRDFLIRMKAEKKIPQETDPEAIANAIIALTIGTQIRSLFLKKNPHEAKEDWIFAVEQMLHVNLAIRKRSVS